MGAPLQCCRLRHVEACARWQAGAEWTGGTDRETPLHRAAFYQHAECMQVLLDEGADPHPGDSRGDTPLHVAASMNRDEAARLLMGAGADVETLNGEGLTPLDLAISNRHLLGNKVYGYNYVWEHNAEVADALLQGGASIVPDRLALGDRHALWPHLTPPGLADEDGTGLHEIPESP